MHRRYALLLAVGLTLAVPGAALADTGFSAVINSAQELSCAVNSTATGTGTFVLNNAQTELTFHIIYTPLQGSLTVAHFHNAPAGVGGGVVRTFPDPETSPIIGVWKNTDAQPLTPALVAQLLAGNIYVNIHSSLCTGGEIRGQVLPDATPNVPTSWGRIKTIYR